MMFPKTYQILPARGAPYATSVWLGVWSLVNGIFVLFLYGMCMRLPFTLATNLMTIFLRSAGLWFTSTYHTFKWTLSHFVMGLLGGLEARDITIQEFVDIKLKEIHRQLHKVDVK